MAAEFKFRFQLYMRKDLPEQGRTNLRFQPVEGAEEHAGFIDDPTGEIILDAVKLDAVPFLKPVPSLDEQQGIVRNEKGEGVVVAERKRKLQKFIVTFTEVEEA